MKKTLKIVLSAISIFIVVVIVAVVLLFIWASKQSAVKDNYFNDIYTQSELESKYKEKGSFDVSFIEYENTTYKKIEVWYPSEIKSSTDKYPLVVMANGTGVSATKYKPIFDHLASWGFIVVGNEDENSWSGKSSAESLNFILSENENNNSIFYQKIDMDNIGIAGHSQGGVGTINAVTNQANGNKYKAMYTASATHIVLSEALKWPYDVSKVNIPYFMVAGTKTVDAGDGVENSDNVGIAPLSSLQENYAKISNDTIKVMARRTNADHGDMLATADAYMTAWFMYWLKDDLTAKNVFYGNSAEILNNTNWQDIDKNI